MFDKLRKVAYIKGADLPLISSTIQTQRQSKDCYFSYIKGQNPISVTRSKYVK